MTPRRDEGWRDRAAIELLGKVLATEALEGPTLLVGFPPGPPLPLLDASQAARWDRMDHGDRPGTVRPPGGPFSSALLRLPRSRESLEFALHLTAAVLAPGATLYVCGAKDEGIGSTGSRLEPLFDDVASLATGGRCRVLRGYRRPSPRELKGALADWREEATVDLGRGPRPWIRYPGTFARKGLDPGTSLLLRNLPAVGAGGRVLDFGAGTGVLGAAVALQAPDADLCLVEPDALARAAAGENLPGARFAPVGSWFGAGPFDAVVSNPPYHQGKAETLGVVRELIEGARTSLAPGGELRFVVQRRHPVESMLAGSFGRVTTVADEGPYRVWAASEADPG